MEAKYYDKLENDKVECLLCPHKCLLSPDSVGLCRIRKNMSGLLHTSSDNYYSAIAVDPIEKKPLYHFFPGKKILSVGAFGCNMRCDWCQNCTISQQSDGRGEYHQPEDLISLIKQDEQNIGIAYTYNEPLISMENNLMLAAQINKAGLKNVLVTNGYVNKKPFEDILKYTHAVNLDVKSFNKENHKKYSSANLDIILRNAEMIYKEGIHLELTMLIVPEVSDNIDDFESFVKWIKDLDVEIPLHISRYFPRYNYHLNSTNEEVLRDFADLANTYLSYVYTGNVSSNSYSNTYCPVCTNEIVSRTGYQTRVVGADRDGICTECGKKVIINT